MDNERIDGDVGGAGDESADLQLELDREMEPIECLDGPEGCSGKVEYRMPLSGTGRSFPRCDKHWGERLDVQERINRDYPDSPIPPAWFDPADAGEHWNEDY